MAPWAPKCDFLIHPQLSEMMVSDARSNASLLSYLYPPQGALLSERTAWRVASTGCSIEAASCWCFHVAGSMLKRANPRGAERCVPKWQVRNCSDPSNVKLSQLAAKDCSCLAADSLDGICLFGDMRPIKLLAVIAAARAAGVRHIIEQGRYGGMSAYMYSLHGFKVTSIELMPLADVSRGLARAAPSVSLIDDDGRRAVIEAVKSSPSDERVAVIFDGEKRMTAYETFKQVRGRVALAAFDDSNLDQGAFPHFLHQQGERAWHTWDCNFARAFDDKPQLAEFEKTLQEAGSKLVEDSRLPRDALQAHGLLDEQGRLIFHGGMEDLGRFHLSLVQGDAIGKSVNRHYWPSTRGTLTSNIASMAGLGLAKRRNPFGGKKE